jgi:hypothetical protein
VGSEIRNTYVLLLIALPGDDAIYSMQQQTAELLNLVVLPVVHPYNELFQCLVQEVSVHRVVGFVEHPFGSLTTSDEFTFDFLVLGLLSKILRKLSVGVRCVKGNALP